MNDILSPVYLFRIADVRDGTAAASIALKTLTDTNYSEADMGTLSGVLCLTL